MRGEMDDDARCRAESMQHAQSHGKQRATCCRCEQRSAASGTVDILKPSDHELVLLRTFAAPRAQVFDAFTSPAALPHWMGTETLHLVSCEVVLHAGGAFRYTFQRPSGKRITVMGAYREVEVPARLVYTESYDFSPLTIDVEVTFGVDDDGRATRMRQCLRYKTAGQRDEDETPVVTGAQHAYVALDRYLQPRS